MTHAKIIKSQMMDWIRESLANDRPVPSDDEIADRFYFDGPVAARSLLADLAEEGGISIVWNADRSRTITLGPKERARLETPRPVPSIVKPSADVDRCVRNIAEIINRKPKPSLAEQVAAEARAAGERRAAARSTGGSIRPFGSAKRVCDKPAPDKVATPCPEAAVAPSPCPVADRPIRLPTAPGRPPRAEPIFGGRQINSKVSPETHAEIIRLAVADGMSASAMCSRLVGEALTARQRPSPAPAKPRIPANVMAAYLADGREFGVFIGHLLELGLTAYLAVELRTDTAA